MGGDFGVSEPMILRSDGQLNVHRLYTPRRDQIAAWAEAHSLTAPRIYTGRSPAQKGE